jgi:predicted phosphodiesterase
MQTFQIVSDVHIESNKTTLCDVIKPIAPILILAGDVGQPTDDNYHIFFEYVTSNWEKIIYVSGNHEYYDTTGIMTMNRVDNMINDMVDKYDNLYYLNNDVIEIDGITIIGSTLWSNPIHDEKLNDFKMNIFDDIGTITLPRFRKLNTDCIDFLEKTLKYKKGKTIVITHFLPLKNKYIPNSKYITTPEMDSYLGNDLEYLMNKTDIWISGHTHQIFDIDYNGTKWLCNAYGQSFENMKYTPMTFKL